MIDNVYYPQVKHYRTYWVNERLKKYQDNPYPILLDGDFLDSPSLGQILNFLYKAFDGLPEHQKHDDINERVDAYYRKPFIIPEGKLKGHTAKFEDADEVCRLYESIYNLIADSRGAK